MEEERLEARRLVEEVEEPDSTGGEQSVEESGEKPEASDIEELREVLSAISSFLRELEQPLRSIFDTLLEAINGARLGEEVGAFYRSLREAGLPEDLAAEMTREYFRERLSSVNIVGILSRALRRELEED